MSETLTYTESEPTASTEVSLNEAEQEALAVGEQMEKDQGNALLAGKYESTEQLEKAYMELQSKLGSATKEPEETSTESEEDTEEDTEEGSSDDTESDLSFLDELYEGSKGEPSEELVKRLENMNASELADMYVQYREQVESQKPEARDFSNQEAEALYNIVGGKDNYQKLTSWAQETLSKQEVSMYDAVMERGDPSAAYWAIRGLVMQYRESNGYEGKRITGKAPRNDSASFRSQAELVQAMSDPRYESDEAYRNDVMSKLANSNLTF